ncbi:MAG: 50S ribosomal protein L22, partial [Deltaproteobacteria bacterium]|nr:50S ribosomal protein L22 [Deltaproteobacteria bacterium]
MEARAITHHVRISPRKARLVADLIRNKGAEEALNILVFTPKRAARLLTKTLKSAIA